MLLLVVVLILPAAYALLRSDLTLPKEQVKAAYRLPNSRFIQWKGAEMHYTESGSNTNMTILMIHGFGGSNRDFLPIDSLLNDQYHIIRVDMPGFGLSDYPFDYDSITFRQAYSAYFDFLLDTLAIDSFYVFGNSLGGLMSIQLAASHPDKVRKLVLFNSAGYDMEEVMKSANANIFRNPVVRYFTQKGMPSSMTSRGLHRVMLADSLKTPERIARVNSMWNREGNLAHLVAMANAHEVLDTTIIPNIHAPTLIIWGQQDQIINVKYAHRFHHDIAGSQLIIYDQCGHVPMTEMPMQVLCDVLHFLKNTGN